MKNIYKALAEFQQAVPVIHKGKDGYGYSYADLPTIFEVINPLLKTHGLGFTQLIEGQQIKTIIFHVESGETLESSTDIPQGVSLAKMNAFQVLGSAITYIRRYALSSALGLVTDKDTDANGDNSKTEEPKKVEPPKTVEPTQPVKKKITTDVLKVQIERATAVKEDVSKNLKKLISAFDLDAIQLELINSVKDASPQSNV